jgi:acetyl-CoA carboxylase biotin carboxylase subunit
VEHPVTEWVTGFDLVKEQLLVAQGETLSFQQADVSLNGWALECRINAENPWQNFRPSPGVIRTYLPPGGMGVRVDSAVFPGYTIPPYYDSMIAKVITWGRDRQEAIARMRRALEEFVIEGVDTTIPFHLQVLTHPKFVAGDFNTKFLEVVSIAKP